MLKANVISALLFTGLLLLSLSKIVLIITSAIHEESEFTHLSQLVQCETERVTAETSPMDTATPPSQAVSHAETPSPYQTLFEENPDFAGWIQIKGTNLDYPVMNTPDDPEFYLHRAFDGHQSKSGTPFIGRGCTLTPRSNNLILYGHNMKNKTMFAPLLQYSNAQFWREHPTINFDTLEQKGEYEVLSAFFIDITPGSGHFPFYHWIDFPTADAQQTFVEICKQLSLYETGLNINESGNFLTLVTCSYHTKNGRFVVVAQERSGISCDPSQP